MSTSAFFQGVSPNLWFSSTLFNQVFGTRFSPADGLPANLAPASWAGSANTGQLAALNGLYERQYDLLSKAEKLSAENRDSVFYQKSAASSDTGVAEVSSFSGNDYEGETPNQSFALNVTSLAREQINQGTILNPTSASAVNVGTNTFTLTAGGTIYNLSVQVISADTNQTVLERMAAAINQADTGVTASVLAGTGGVRIELTGETGSAGAFSLTNTAGNAVTASGANTTTQTAANAVFTVDGTPYSQANNQVFLLSGKLELELKAAGTATVTVGEDTSAMASAISDFLDAANEYSSYLASNSFLAPSLASSWASITQRIASDLDGYGVTRGSLNQLSLNTTTLNSALAQDVSAVMAALGGPDGVVQQVKALAERVIGSPGARLLASPPTSGLGAQYLRSLTSAPRFRIGQSLFWQVV
jgi:flagellar hook-associated protein 2